MFIYDEEGNKIEIKTAFYCLNCGKGICSNVDVDKRSSGGNFIQLDIKPCSCLEDDIREANTKIKSLEDQIESLQNELDAVERS